MRSGGQTGVDRAALDVARELGTRTCGWCPHGGWAEDMTSPPGLLAVYPELVETPSADGEQRTVWNVRDSHATLVVLPRRGTGSPGTDLTRRAAVTFGRPLWVLVDDDIAGVRGWLAGLGRGLTVNVAGPRESEAPGIYARTRQVLRAVLR